MTVAVGIVQPDFVVIAADSQEGWAWGGMTREVTKLEGTVVYKERKDGSTERNGIITVSGSGGSDYLSYLRSSVKTAFREQFHGSDATTTLDDFKQTIEEIIYDFFHKHFVPFANEPEHQFLRPDLLVAAELDGKKRLWVTYYTTVKQVEFGWEVVGSGNVWAKVAMDDARWSDVRGATLAAMYAVYQAKEHTESCGKGTDAVAVFQDSNGYPTARFVFPEQVRKIEEVFRTFNGLQRLELNALLAAPDSHYATIYSNELIAELRAKLANLDPFDVGITPPPDTDQQ